MNPKSPEPARAARAQKGAASPGGSSPAEVCSRAAASLGTCLRRAAACLALLALPVAIGTYVLLPDAAKLPALLGIAAGLVACFLALVLEGRALCASADDGVAAGMRFQVALALGFAVLFASLCGSVGVLLLAGVKFATWSAFALAFAGSAFVLHVAGALVLMRARNKPTSSATSACRAA